MFTIFIFGVATHACYIGSKVLISLFALELGASQLTIGFLASLYGAAPLLLGIYSGVLSDRAGPRLPILLGAGCMGIAMVIGYFGQNLPVLFITVALLGTGFVFFNVSLQNLTGICGGPEKRAQYFSLLAIGYSVSSFIGPMTAGYSIEYLGHAQTFLVLGALTLVPFVALGIMRKLGVHQPVATHEAQRSTLTLLRVPELRSIIIISGLVCAASDLFAFYVPIYGHSIGLAPSAIGTILGVTAIAAIMVRFGLPLALRRWRPQQVLAASMLSGTLAFAAFPLTSHFYLLAALALVIGIGVGCGQPLSMTLAFDRSPQGRTGEVTGLRLTANNFARVVIPIFAGTLGSTLGTAPVFWANAFNLLLISHLARRT